MTSFGEKIQFKIKIVKLVNKVEWYPDEFMIRGWYGIFNSHDKAIFPPLQQIPKASR